MLPTSPTKVDTVLKAFWNEVAELKAKGPSETNVEKVKKQWIEVILSVPEGTVCSPIDCPQVCFGRCYLFGVYLNKAFSHYTPYYERAGIRVVLGKERKHFVGFAIKAHAGSADFLEWTYGYNFFKWFDRKPNRLNKS